MCSVVYIPDIPGKLDVVLALQWKKQVLERRNKVSKDTCTAWGAEAGWSPRV